MALSLEQPAVGKILSEAKSIYVSACTAEIADARGLLRRHRPVDATVTGIFSPVANQDSYADPEIGLRARTFFLHSAFRRHLAMGWVDFCPWRYGVVNQFLTAPGRFDTAMVMLSPPDQNGQCSLGVHTDFLPEFLSRIDRVIGFINPNMPRTAGHTFADYKSLAAVVDYDVPMREFPLNDKPDAAVEAIVRSVANIIPDNATVQAGIGQIPSLALAGLKHHKGLRVHTGIIDDAVLVLDNAGALDRDHPMVTGCVLGTHALYGELSDARRFAFKPAAYTHAFGTITQHKRFHAINSALQVDLFGQVSAEGSGGKFVATPGGLPDFVRGALHSEGGKAIIALRASGMKGRANNIVPFLGSPHVTTLSPVDADVIVTEYGAAHIRHLAMDQRAEALIAIADPGDRAMLSEQWQALRRGALPSPRAD